MLTESPALVNVRVPVPTSVDPPPPHAVNINMDRDKIIQALNFNTFIKFSSNRLLNKAVGC